MNQITEEECIKLMKERFPKLLPYWESFLRDFDGDEGIITQMMPFENYTIDVIKSNDEAEIKKIFDLAEFLLCNGNESVQNAIATGFLEYLMNNDPDEIKFSSFAKHLGQESIEYCRAWDNFTGVKTEGLWNSIQEDPTVINKQKICFLLEMYLCGNVSRWNFCSEFCRAFNPEQLTNATADPDYESLMELNAIVQDFLEAEKDSRNHERRYNAAVRLEQKIAETKHKLKPRLN